uniref:Piwi domain-containing protein n=1 Tax=Ditylenchus dipsaci TaxID=166011 RepID=A0A915DUQ1_9BILA
MSVGCRMFSLDRNISSMSKAEIEAYQFKICLRIFLVEIHLEVKEAGHSIKALAEGLIKVEWWCWLSGWCIRRKWCRIPSTRNASKRIEKVKATDVPNRTFVGTLGRNIKLIVNYFNMNYLKGLNFFNYHINVFIIGKKDNRREIKSRRLLRKHFWAFVSNNEEFFGGRYNSIYDDRNLLYTLKKLNMDGKSHSFEMNILEPDGRSMRIVIEIQFIKQAPVDFNTLNLALSQFARCTIAGLMSPVPKVYCETDHVKGVRATAKKGPGGIALANYDVVHSSFFKLNVDILQFYAVTKQGRCLSEGDLLQLRDYSLNPEQRRDMCGLLNGIMLKTKEQYGVVRNYRFGGVSNNGAASTFFERVTYNEQGERVSSERLSVLQYYQQHHNYQIRFPNMPLIQCMPMDKQTYIPMELLMIHEEVQRLRRILPDELQAKTNNFTSRLPRQRFSDIDQIMEDVHVTDDPFLQNCGISVDPRMLEIDGRVLPPPICTFSLPQGAQMSAKAVLAPRLKVLFSLVLVNNCLEFDGSTAECFNHLVAGCELRGISFLQKNPAGSHKLDYRRNRGALGDMLLELDKKAKTIGREAIHMILLVVDATNEKLYNAIKTECELRDKPPMQNSVTRNIFLKLNAKMGGVNNRISTNFESWKKFVNPNEPTLFIGIDVTHPPQGDTEFPSISSLVGNVDVEASKYVASVRVQIERTEWINDMKEMSKERIDDFKKANGKLPKHIVIMRDGVSESQFRMVIDQELADLQRACQAVDKSYRPTLTVLIVQKRHGTRFYAEDANFPGVNRGNVPPGTVVDKFITKESGNVKGPEKEFEFFLCAHKGMLGTSRPAHYYMLFDNWD